MNPPPPPPMPSGPNNPHVMESNTYKEPSQVSHSFVIFMNIVNTVTHLLLGGVTICAFVAANILRENPNITRSVAFEQHILLCVTGYVILMSQAILTMQPHAGWASTLKYPQKRNVHWVLQVIGSIMAIAGSAIKINDSRNPFDNTHGVMGLCALVLTCCSLLGGLIHIICSNLSKTLFYETFYSILGALTITFAFITLCLGFSSSLYTNILEDKNANYGIALSVLALAGVLLASVCRIIRRFSQ